MAIRENVYLEAARAIGASTMRMTFRHIFPNVAPQIIIIFSAGLGGIVMTEAALSFIGYGIPPPLPSWGGMLSGSGRQYFLLAPWLSVWPGVALASFIFGANMLGDGLRDILDPRLRGGFGRYAAVKEKRGGALAFIGLKRRS